MRLDSICDNEHVKRACEVALAGEHSILFIGAHDSQAQDLTKAMRQCCDEMSQPYPVALAVTPCPCGNYGGERVCTCTAEMVNRWRDKHFPPCPLDITVEVVLPDANKLLAWMANSFRSGEQDEVVIDRIEAAHSNLRSIAMPDNTGASLLKAAIIRRQLGPRQVKSIISVATTIARLAGASSIHAAHLAEAIQYRPRKEY